MMTDTITKGTLAIIGCKLFEDEMAYLLSRDQNLEHLIVVGGEDSEGISKKIGQMEHNFTVETINEGDIPSEKITKGYSILLWIKPMALHQKPEKLNDDVTTTIRKVQGCCDAVLLFYGLCGNAFKNIEAVTQDFSVPVVILRDRSGNIIDDCIGAVLGGTVEYYEQLKKSSGTFFLTPMWADNWRELFHKVQILPDSTDIEGAKYVFECVGYKNVIKLDTGLGDSEKFDAQINEFAEIFNFKKSVISCTTKVMEDSFDQAKRLL